MTTLYRLQCQRRRLCRPGLPRCLDRAAARHAPADGDGQHNNVRVYQGEEMGGQLDPRQAVLLALPHELLPVLLPPGERVWQDGRHVRPCAKSGTHCAGLVVTVRGEVFVVVVVGRMMHTPVLRLTPVSAVFICHCRFAKEGKMEGMGKCVICAPFVLASWASCFFGGDLQFQSSCLEI